MNSPDISERQTLGALLIRPEVYYQIASLRPEDFASARNRETYATITGMIRAGDVVDVVTVAGRLPGAESFTDLAALAAECVAPSNAPAHAEAVRTAARRRHIRHVLSDALQRVDRDEPGEVTGELFRALEDQRATETTTTLSDAVTAALSQAEDAARRQRDGVVGVTTTIPSLDRLTGGLHGGRLVTLGGRPGTYKSTLSWQIAIRAARSEIPAGVISLEIGAAELATRAIANEMKISGQLLAAGDDRVLQIARRKLAERPMAWPVFIDDQAQTLADILTRIAEWRHRHGVQLVVIDYLQLIGVKGRSKREEIGQVTRELKLLAMRHGLPILLLSQLSRYMEREGRRPQLSDLRESGDIEQDSDIVLLMHETDDDHELILAKQRAGPARKIVPLFVDGNCFLIGEKRGNP